MSKHNFEDDNRPNTLGLHARELDSVIDNLDVTSRTPASSTSARSFVRWPFRTISVPVTIFHPGGTTVTMRLACRNLSRGGAGMLHNGFLHTGSRCAVTLTHQSGEERRIDGIISRCEHRGGVLHEIGVRFDELVNIRDFIHTDMFERWFSLERVEPASLEGTLLLVEGSTMDQRIVRHYLRETDLKVRCTDSVEEAAAIAKEGVDIILCEYYLPDRFGYELVTALREERIVTPIIMTSGDTSPNMRRMMKTVQSDAFLAKPFTQDDLVRAIAEFLCFREAIDDAGPACFSAQVTDELSLAFAHKVKEYARQLETILSEDRAMDAYVICVQLKGTAPALGYRCIGEQATALATRLSDGDELLKMRKQVQDLICACRDARTDD